MKEKINNIINNIIKNKFKIVILLYVLSILIYELLFCNAKIFLNQGYSFSLCRTTIYVVFLVVLYLLRNRIITNNITHSEIKLRKIILFVYALIALALIGLILLWGIKKGFEITALLLITIFLTGVFALLVNDNFIKNTIIICFTFGIIFCTTTNLNHRFDERKHFITAFNVSFANLNYQEEFLCDNKILNIGNIEDITKSTGNFNKIYTPELSDDIELDHFSTPTNNSFILYIPSAIGMLIARILKGSLLDMYLMGRLFNLLAYMFFSIAILKILPYKKNIFFIILNMPLIILLAASYSIDATSLGLVSIFIAYSLKLYEQKEKITFKQLILLCCSLLCLVIAKSMAYIAVALIVFILPVFKLLKENKKYIPIFIMIIGAIGIIALSSKTKNVETDTRAYNANSSEQINLLIKNPIRAIPVLYRHTRDTLFNFNWFTELNTENFFYSFARGIFMLMFLFVIIIALNDDTKKFKLKEKIIFIFTFFIVFAMTSFALYIGFTQVGGRTIEGYQARYIIPILPLVLMVLNNNLIKVKINYNEKYIISIVWGLITLIDVIGLIMV